MWRGLHSQPDNVQIPAIHVCRLYRVHPIRMDLPSAYYPLRTQSIPKAGDMYSRWTYSCTLQLIIQQQLPTGNLFVGCPIRRSGNFQSPYPSWDQHKELVDITFLLSMFLLRYHNLDFTRYKIQVAKEKQCKCAHWDSQKD